MSSDLVDVERRGRVAIVTLRRPDRLNAISAALADALGAAVGEVAADDGVGALVVAGEGRVFSAGADIAALSSLEDGAGFAAFVRHLTVAFDCLASCPKPSVAALHGVALGGGLELAMACDQRIAAEGTRLGVPEIALGLLPGAGGTVRLPRLVPASVATRMVLTGDPLDATEAFAAGLVDRVVPAEEVLAAAVALAERWADLPALALAAAKRLLAGGRLLEVDEAIDREREVVASLFDTEDRGEGVSAFLEKRVARFTGR